MEYDGPFRRFSLQEHGRYVGQRVGTNSNPDLLSAIPSEYEELSPNYHYVHKVGPLHAPRKLSLEEYRMMQQVPGVSQFQPVYSMPYPIQMASPARPVQEVQPYGVDRSPPGLSQSLQIQAMKRRHMLRSQQSQSQGYAPQQLQGTVYTEQPENFTSECPTSQPSQRQPSRQVQSCSNMYGFQQMEPTQSYGSVPSHLLSVSSPVESPMSMPTMSPVQMVRPIQQYQHMGSGSSLQFVPMQTLSGTHGAPFAYRGNSMEDDVFVAYQPMEMPYFDQDNSIYEFEQAQPQYVANHPSAQQSYVGIQRSPTSASESGDSTNVKRVTRTPRSHKDLRVSFVDELPEFQRERSFSSPPYMAPYMAPKEGNTDTEPYVGLKRADSRAVPRKTSPLADRTNETNKPEPEDPSNTYAGLRRLPRDKTTAVRSAKEKKEAAENEVDGQHQNTSAALSGVGEKTEDSDETGDVENRLPMNKPAVMRRAGEPRETAAVNKPYGDGERAQVRDARRTSVPARMRSYSEALVNTEKNRRNSFCPMTAYNLR